MCLADCNDLKEVIEYSKKHPGKAISASNFRFLIGHKTDPNNIDQLVIAFNRLGSFDLLVIAYIDRNLDGTVDEAVAQYKLSELIPLEVSQDDQRAYESSLAIIADSLRGASKKCTRV